MARLPGKEVAEPTNYLLSSAQCERFLAVQWFLAASPSFRPSLIAAISIVFHRRLLYLPSVCVRACHVYRRINSASGNTILTSIMDHDVIIQSGDNVRCLYNEILSESETYSREHNICEFCIGFCIRIIIERGRTVNSTVIVIGSVGERTVSWKNWTILILFFVCVCVCLTPTNITFPIQTTWKVVRRTFGNTIVNCTTSPLRTV